MPSELVYEMGYRADEFGNVLCGPFSGAKSDYESETLKANHWRVKHRASSFSVEIRVSEQPDRELGLFRLPVLQVRFQVHNDSGADAGRFFTRFHQYFHKGGG